MKNFAVSLTVSIIFGTLPLFAQNKDLNPTVQVTNDYKNTVGEMEKHTLSTVIPDSLFKFDLNFDYSGFENPYRGGTEFNPFFTELEFAPESLKGKRFYLKAGAGYTLSPEFDLCWSFKETGRLKMGLVVSSKSHVGAYDRIVAGDPSEFSRGGTLSRHILKRDGTGSFFNLFDSRSSAILNARADWDRASMTFAFGYDNVVAKSCADLFPEGSNRIRNFNSFGGDLLLQSNLSVSQSPVRYLLGIHYSYGRDNVAPAETSEHSARLQGELGFRMGKSFLELSVLGNMLISKQVTDGGTVDRRGWDAVISPRYRLSSGRFSMGLGVGLFLDGANQMNPGKSNFYLWPSVKMEWNAVRGYLDLYLTSDIQERIYGAREQALDHHFYIPYYTMPAIVLTRYSAFGLRGNIARRVNWDVSGGYRMVGNAPVFKVTDASSLFLDFTDLKSFYAALSVNGNVSGFSFNVGARYDKYVNVKAEYAPQSDAILPPELSADVDLKYTFRSRLSIGAGFTYTDRYLSLAYATEPVAVLRAIVEYKFASPLSIYLKGNNLLGHSMQIIPFYSPVGPEITAGIVLNF